MFRRFCALALPLVALALALPASASTTYSNIQTYSGWQSCSVCAGPNGSGPVAQYSTKQWVSSPSLDGKSMQFWIGGSNNYASALWWRQLGGNNSVHNFSYDLWVYTQNPTVQQALEFDVNQSANGLKYIFGTQCNFKGDHRWDVWDTANARWVATSLTCAQFPSYGWVHLDLQFQRTSNNMVRFIGVQINGTMYYINKYFYPRAVNAYEINTAFQEDLDSTHTAYSVWLDKVTLTYW